MIDKRKKYHFIGIGGIGMSALAKILLKKNIAVSGSDIASSAVTESLIRDGADVKIGHSADNITNDMIVVYTTDIKADNPEFCAAKRSNSPMIHRSKMLQEIAQSYKSLAVSGTHGKTSTTSLLAWVLDTAGFSPSYAIGGIVPQFSSNAGGGEGEYFVMEACESDRSFLNYHPYGAIVTNVDFDHMEHYESKEDHIAAFKTFMSQVTSKEHLIWCGDDPVLRGIGEKGVSYGFEKGNALQLSAYKQNGWKISYDIDYAGKKYRDVEVSLIGKHNALNSAAVFGLCLSLGIGEEAIRKALSTFRGVLRRCEYKGVVGGIDFYDDYGHHPTEIKTTIKAIKTAIGDRKLVVVYQPHRYSRAQHCMGQYAGVFDEADEIFITTIYSAGEDPIPGVTSEKIYQEIKGLLKAKCHFIDRDNAATTLAGHLQSEEVCLTLGAGNITKLAAEFRDLCALKK